MRGLALTALFLLVAAAGCGDGAAGNPELDRLAAEVQAATQALLEAPGFVGTTVRTGDDGAVNRADWADWRATGDFRFASLFQAVPEAEPAVLALVQIGAAVFSAQRGPDGDELWQRRDVAPLDRIPLNLELAAIAAGTTSPLADVEGGAEATRTAGPDGSVRWEVASPARGDRLLQAWLIDGNGVLRSYSARADSGGAFFGDFASVEYGFDPLADPAPIIPPPLGEALDLDALGVPPGFPLTG